MADVTKNILFTVGTVGAGAAASKMAALATKVALVGTAVVAATAKLVNMTKEAARFQQTVDSVRISMTRFNETTAGLIDTAKSYSAAAKLQNANVKITGEQFAALGQAATKAAQAAGEGPQGATARFERLSKAIITGRETALKEFGIEVSQTSDLIAFQAEALQKLTEQYGDFSAAAETAEEKVYAFGNTLGTVVDFTLAVGAERFNEMAASWLGGSEVLSQFEKDLVATKGEMAKYYDLLTDSTTVELAHNEAFKEKVKEAGGWRRLSTELYLAGELNASIAVKQAGAYNELAGSLQSAALAARNLRQFMVGGGEDVKTGAAFSAAGLAFAARNIVGPAKTKASRKGTGGGASTSSIGPLFDPVAGSGVDPLGAGLLDDITGAGAAAAAGAEFDAVAQAERERQAELNRIALEEQRKLNAEMDALYKQDAENRKKAMETMGTTTVKMFGNMAEIIGQESRAAFNARKAMMIPMLTMEGIMAAMAGYRQVVAMVPPPVGPVVGAAYAATIGAVYARKIKEMASQKYGGKGTVSNAVSTASAGGSLGSGGDREGTTIVNNIIVEGQTIHSGMIRANERAQQNGEPSFQTDTSA